MKVSKELVEAMTDPDPRHPFDRVAQDTPPIVVLRELYDAVCESECFDGPDDFGGEWWAAKERAGLVLNAQEQRVTEARRIVFVPCLEHATGKWTVRHGTDPGTFKVIANCESQSDAERLAVAMRLAVNVVLKEVRA